MGEDSLAYEADDAADENSGADEERRTSGADLRARGLIFRCFRRSVADLLQRFTGDV